MPYKFIFRVDDQTVFQAQLHNEQCAAHTKTGERCKRRVIIGLDLCYSHLLSVKHLRIKPSTIPEAGRGLFALNPKVAKDAIIFKTGDVIADYIGETLSNIQLRQRYHGHTAPYTIQLAVGKNPPATSVYEDCALVRGYAALCNQALRKREQNARLRVNTRLKPHRAQLVAMKNIRNDCEVLTHYGEMYEFDEDAETKYVR